MVEFRLLGGCVRVKSECNTTFQHLKHIAQIQSKFKAKYLHRRDPL